MSRIRILALALVLAVPLGASALEAPHDASSGYACKNCHLAHQSLGTSLTKTNTNAALCDSCHVSGLSFGFPFTSNEQAQAGVSGSAHSWSGSANNAAVDAVAPDPHSVNTLAASMGGHLDGGTKLKCSTCHDVHQADANGGTVHASRGWATNIPTTAGSGTGTLKLTATPAGAKAAGYVIKISGTNQFKISHDNGTSWFGYSTTALNWSADSNVGYTNGKSFTPGTAVSLDDAITTVTFSSTGTFTSQVWAGFYVSYPYLRGDGPTMCMTCHQNRNQTYQNVEGSGTVVGTLQPVLLSTTVFSHPVNQGLNANGGGYDAASASSILDADGSWQGSGTEGNPTNDLTLNASGNVTCMTCHYPHNADSNSLTVDPR